MDRRMVLGSLVAVAAAGCGGGGGSTSGITDPGTAIAPTPAPAPTAAPAPAPVAGGGVPSAAAQTLSPNVACWGDSLTAPVAPNLQLLVPDRFVFDGGVAGQTSEQILAREQANPQPAWINVFWMGHNNNNEPDQIRADIATSVTMLASNNNRFIVLGLINKALPQESPGSVEYQTIITLNQQLAAQYPNNYIDIRPILVNSYNPDLPQDVQDHQNNLVPSSLRFDEIHLNNDGSVIVAKTVKAFMDARGW